MPDRRWSILATREGDTSTRRFRFSGRRVVTWLAVAATVVAAASFWIGAALAGRRAEARLAELSARADSLTEENAKVAAVAGRLVELEASYDRLRAVMGGEVAASARDILLPPARSGETERARTVAAERGPSVWPLVEAGFVTRSFGDTVPGEGPHAGLDIAVPVGSYVRSAGPGVVLEAGEDREYGRYVRVRHADDVRTLYAHNSWTFVAPGDSVEAGEVIALSGNTGRSTAPHLHLEVERDGARVDPLPYVSDRL